MLFRSGVGGRLVSATSTTVTFDKEIVLDASTTYYIKIRLDDDTVVDKTIVENDGTFTTVTMATAFTVTPQPYSPYATYTTTKGVKPFRIVEMSIDDKEMADLTLAEYSESVYTDTDAGTLSSHPTVNYSMLNPLPTVTNLTLDELWTILNDGTIGDEIIIQFEDIQNNIVSGYEIWYNIKDTGGNVIKGWQQDATVTDESYKLQNVLVGCEYEIAVLTVNHLGAKQKIQDAAKATITTLGKNALPTDVANFTVTEKDFNIVMSWDNIPDADLSFYEIQDQNNAVIYQGKNNTFKYNMQAADSYAFKIKAVDKIGRASCRERV